ncbi:MAG: VWA domain-containing protein [Kofleriaceae bacterium]|nr:VWA domain-containing protein [Kofleriaceae bacterium]
MLHSFELAEPVLLILLILVPAAYVLAYLSRGRVVYSSLRLLPAHSSSWRTRLAWLPDALVAAAVAAMVVAAAGPRRGEENSKIRREGIAIMCAIDISGSMLALDLSPPKKEQTRLDAVKEVFERFVLGGNDLSGRPDDAIGLVSFARYADTRSPLTLDHANLIAAARQLQLVSDRSEDGTAIGAGLALGVERLRSFKAKSKVLVLLTDGVQNFDEISIDAAIDDARAGKVKVYTIGAGTNGMAAVRVPTGDGGSRLMQTEVQIDEQTLGEIAEKTGGKYFRATDNASLKSVYEQINTLERTTIEDTQFVNYQQLFASFLAAGMALLVLALLLRATVFRRVP